MALYLPDLTADEARALRAEDVEREYRRDLAAWELRQLAPKQPAKETPAQRFTRRALTVAAYSAIAAAFIVGARIYLIVIIAGFGH